MTEDTVSYLPTQLIELLLPLVLEHRRPFTISYDTVRALPPDEHHDPDEDARPVAIPRTTMAIRVPTALAALENYPYGMNLITGKPAIGEDDPLTGTLVLRWLGGVWDHEPEPITYYAPLGPVPRHGVPYDSVMSWVTGHRPAPSVVDLADLPPSAVDLIDSTRRPVDTVSPPPPWPGHVDPTPVPTSGPLG